MELKSLTLPLVALLALAPFALADSSAYIGGAIGAGFCEIGPNGEDAGLACELECTPACVVTVTDTVLGSDVLFQVCDWDGESDVNCSDIVSSGYRHESTTGIVDVFLVAATTGTVTTTNVA